MTRELTGWPSAEMRDYPGVPVLYVDCAYPGKVTEARLSVAARQDHPPSLCRVSGEDQIVCAARGAGPADIGKQAPMVSRCRLRVVKDIDGGHYRNERPSAFGCPAWPYLPVRSPRGTRRPIPRRWPVHHRPATSGPWFRLVGDQDVGIEGQASATGRVTSEFNQGDGFCYIPAEFLVWRRHVGERRAQVGAGTAMGGADLRDWMAAAHDGDRLTALRRHRADGEVP